MQKAIKAKGKSFHESIYIPTTIPSIINHMEEYSPCPLRNPKQNSKEALAPQQNRNSAPIAHRKGPETRKEDAMTAPPADHHTQDPQQNRMLQVAPYRQDPRSQRQCQFLNSTQLLFK